MHCCWERKLITATMENSMEIPLKELKKKTKNSFCSKDQVVGMSKDCPCCYSHSVMSDSFVTTWTLACQALLSTGFPRQEYWSGLQFLSPWDLPDPQGSNLHLLNLQVDSLPLSHLGSNSRLVQVLQKHLHSSALYFYIVSPLILSDPFSGQKSLFHEF